MTSTSPVRGRGTDVWGDFTKEKNMATQRTRGVLTGEVEDQEGDPPHPGIGLLVHSARACTAATNATTAGGVSTALPHPARGAAADGQAPSLLLPVDVCPGLLRTPYFNALVLVDAGLGVGRVQLELPRHFQGLGRLRAPFRAHWDTCLVDDKQKTTRVGFIRRLDEDRQNSKNTHANQHLDARTTVWFLSLSRAPSHTYTHAHTSRSPSGFRAQTHTRESCTPTVESLFGVCF